MTVVSEEKRATKADDAEWGLRHLYPLTPEYRLSGQLLPTVGDRAVCGWRKRYPPQPPAAYMAMPPCVVCFSGDA